MLALSAEVWAGFTGVFVGAFIVVGVILALYYLGKKEKKTLDDDEADWWKHGKREE